MGDSYMPVPRRIKAVINRTPLAVAIQPRALIAGKQPIVLEGLRRIAEQAGLQVVGTITDGQSLIRAADLLSPDLIIVDTGTPGLHETDAARDIRERNPGISLLFLTVDRTHEMYGNGAPDGAHAYVPRGANVRELSAAMHEVLERDEATSTTQKSQALAGRNEADPKLTPRQVEVLQLVTEGRTAKEIGSTLNISARTVEFHKSRIMEILGLRTTAELTRYAVLNRLSIS